MRNIQNHTPSKVRGTCPNCGTKIEADLRPKTNPAVVKAWNEAWRLFDAAFKQFDNMFSAMKGKE